MLEPIKIGISSCLLGNKVRYDGGHSHDRFLTQTLGLFTEYVPVCPEVECGMPTPREAVRLVGDPENPRLMTQKTAVDKTDQMNVWIKGRLEELAREDLCGFIFRSKSPSSGLYRIRVYGEDGSITKNGTGLFARAFTKAFPRVPVEEAGRLNDPKLRESFIENIFSLQRWRKLCSQNMTLGGLVDFHTQNKLLILSHNQGLYRQMGKLVAHGKDVDIDQLFDMYEELLLKALSLQTTLKKNINVLQHILGYFKKDLSNDEKQELLTIIDKYRSGYVPLIVPITLIKHYVMKYDQPWLKIQTYLNPHPFELKLRNYF
ncbi:conserved hypothetical protein [Desulforapulum autotrophicum HRM2]|uniref:DUF1722 domain-containing protein n=1 Tax=Desulforapulum autotrophicum (strain ATCC 43914 / DSM 3382 / VKM B-1955 / HRM2) TaxID=177437 RepID=C0QDT6_DESAH|nr:DUF523 and DUF1722 domain-containing protein [Desulforapulum autotrophicum]ACN17357.1 conserved hypothetical protein [Desulforapulum autotrophicum HRM2]